MRSIRVLFAAALFTVIVVEACHKAPPPAPPAPVTTATNNDAANQQRIRDSIAAAQRAAQLAAQQAAAADAARRARDDSIARANAASRDQAAMRAALTQVIHFDFDKSDLRDDAKAALDAKVPILAANPGVTVRVAGHTDEKGTAEYNLALGQRRAMTAKRYLMDHGIAEARIETVSYGMERPAVQGKDESAYSQNRRDEFQVTAGGSGMLNKPR